MQKRRRHRTKRRRKNNRDQKQRAFRGEFVKECDEKYPSFDLLEKAKEKLKEKEVDNDSCLCTGFDVGNETFCILMRYWLASLILTHGKIPSVRIIYKGDKPDYFEDFPMVDLAPSLWKLDLKNRSVGSFNFTMKIQALLGGHGNKVNCWVDADILFVSDISDLFTSTSFIEKRGRFAGGFYSLSNDARSAFCSEYVRLVEKHSEDDKYLHSDQRIIREGVKASRIGFKGMSQRKISESKMFLHISRGDASRDSFRVDYVQALEKLMEC